MQCTKCQTGALRQAAAGTSAGTLVVCDNPDCFTWFTVDANRTVTERQRVTKAMKGEFSDSAKRRSAVQQYPLIDGE